MTRHFDRFTLRSSASAEMSVRSERSKKTFRPSPSTRSASQIARSSDAARDEISAAYHAREEIERSWRRISSRAFPRRSKWTAEALLQ